MYIVRFIRWDGQPNEEYCYPKVEDAKHHFELFLKDDSFLYSKIMILDANSVALDTFIPAKRG